MATIDYKQLSTPEANLIELLSAQNQDGTYSAKLMGSEPFSVLAAKTIYNTYNDIESNMAADVEGPASSTDNALARFDGTTGKLIQNSNAILTDAGALSLASNLTVSGTGTSTFGGNLTVSGTGTSSVAGTLQANGGTAQSVNTPALRIGNDKILVWLDSSSTTTNAGFLWYDSSNILRIGAGNGTRIQVSAATTTISNNLTVSGTGGITSSSISPLFKATSSALGSAPKLTLENTNLGAWNVYLSGTDGGDFKIDQDSTNKFRIAYGTGNATLSGNLTVSGTGVSSVGGSFGIGTTTPTTINGVASAFQQVANVTGSGTCALNITGTQAILSLVDSNASANVKWLTLQNSNGVSTLGVLNDAGSVTQTGFQFFHSTGNFLFGTGSDGGNGKLQLATHTTSAGGIGFGTALSMYRSSDNSAWIDAASGNVQLILGRAGTANLAVLSDGSNVYASAAQAGMGMIFRTNGSTTALTLTSTQSAQFAGSLAIKNTSDLQFAYPFDTSVATGRIGWWNGSGIGVTIGQTSANVLTLNTSGAAALTLDGLQNATFAGMIKLGGTTSSYPALKRGSEYVEFKLADDSAYAPITALRYTLKDGVTAPSSVAGFAFLYVDTADGSLKVKFGNGTTKTIATNP